MESTFFEIKKGFDVIEKYWSENSYSLEITWDKGKKGNLQEFFELFCMLNGHLIYKKFGYLF